MRTVPQHCREELSRLFPSDFPHGIGRELLIQYPRYLNALRIRSERAYASPDKDHTKAIKLRPLEEALARLPQPLDPEKAQYLEELRIAIFAPELGTLYPVSEKGLLRLLEEAENL